MAGFGMATPFFRAAKVRLFSRTASRFSNYYRFGNSRGLSFRQPWFSAYYLIVMQHGKNNIQVTINMDLYYDGYPGLCQFCRTGPW